MPITINKDHTGKTSANRTIALLAWVVFCLCWGWATYKSGNVADIPYTALLLLSLATGGQIGNRFLTEILPKILKVG